MSYRIRLLETEEGWSVSCLDLPGCHSQGFSREEALTNIREAIALWLEVEAEEGGERRLVIPRHDPINAITMGAIARDAGLTPAQFRELL